MECSHASTQIRKQKFSDGREMVAKQCLYCGKRIGNFLSQAGVTMALLPSFDESLKTEWETAEANEWQATQAKFREEQESKSGLWWDTYQHYLESDHWRKLRLIVLNRDILCQMCFVHRSNQVHHLTYSSFNKYGCSFSVECVGLCQNCHNTIHSNEGSNGPA